jgi:hypothetical protein
MADVIKHNAVVGLKLHRIHNALLKNNGHVLISQYDL